MGVHDVGHMVPPFADDGVLRQRIRGVAVGEFLHGEQGQGFRIEEDRVVGNPGLGESAGEFGPDLIVAFPVFGWPSRA